MRARHRHLFGFVVSATLLLSVAGAPTASLAAGTPLAQTAQAAVSELGLPVSFTVTVSAPPGSAGNAYTATSSYSPLIAVQGTGAGSAYFSGGKDADTVSMNGQTFSALATAPQYTDAPSLATVIGATAATNATAAASGDTVTVTASAPGAAGNAITLATNNPSDTTLSGATLTGGSNGTLALTFSQPISGTASAVLGDLSLSNGHTFGTTGLSASFNGTNTVLTIDLGDGATVTGGDTITLTGVTDAAGNPVASPVTVPALP